MSEDSKTTDTHANPMRSYSDFEDFALTIVVTLGPEYEYMRPVVSGEGAALAFHSPSLGFVHIVLVQDDVEDRESTITEEEYNARYPAFPLATQDEAPEELRKPAGYETFEEWQSRAVSLINHSKTKLN